MSDDVQVISQPASVGESAYQKIRSDIIFGRLPPGRKLKLDRLKADYGASVSTLREILNRLHSERLVVAEGQKGFEVAPVSIANLREIAALRQLLECRRSGAVVSGRRHGMGGACRRRPSPARPDGGADGPRRPGPYGGVEAL